MSTATGTLVAAREPMQWKRSHLLMGLGVASLAGILVYLKTFAAMVQTWLSTDTYVHGFVILPIVAFLVWRLRAQLATLPLRPARAGLAGILVLTCAWFVATWTDIRILQQLTATAMLPAVIYTIAGEQVSRRIAFPLAYLVFAVPMGDELVPWLMSFTADFTVQALELTGIPVYREGLLFSTSRGDFAVEKACSGVRYLIASVALGALYAYLAYRSPWRRAAFIALAAVVPILANGLRAYLIVVLAHASDMKIAIGIDHIIYGWIFFGIVMFGLFAAGRLFRERDAVDAAPAAAAPASPVREHSEPAPFGGAVVLTAFVIIAMFAGPGAYAFISQSTHTDAARPALAPLDGDWSGPYPADAAWHPAYSGYETQLQGSYRRGRGPAVDLAVVYYGGAAGGGEVGDAAHRVADHQVWREFDSGRETLTLGSGERVPVRTSWLRGAKGRRLAWWLYVVDGEHTSSNYVLKWRESLARLQGRYRGSALLAVSVAYEDDPAPAVAALSDFLGANLTRLAACAGTSGEQPAACVDRPDP